MDLSNQSSLVKLEGQLRAFPIKCRGHMPVAHKEDPNWWFVPYVGTRPNGQKPVGYAFGYAMQISWTYFSEQDFSMSRF